MRVAFLGAGNMAQGMILNALAAGYDVRVFNRTASRIEPLAEKGARPANTPKLAAQDADVVVSMVTNDEASRACWLGPNGALAAQWANDGVGVESSTVSVGWIAELNAAATTRQILDAPVAGRPDAALAASLLMFAGGNAQALHKVRPLLEKLSRHVFHFGPSGAGIVFKLLYNAVGAVQIAAVAEAMVALERLGINLETAAEAFAMGSTGSPNVTRAVPHMTGGAYTLPPQFPGAGRLKDLRYARDAVDTAQGSFLLGDAAIAVFKLMADLGMEQSNDTEVVNALRMTLGKLSAFK